MNERQNRYQLENQQSGFFDTSVKIFFLRIAVLTTDTAHIYYLLREC